jgi:hypothetical protein
LKDGPGFECAGSVAGHLDLVPPETQQDSRALGSIGVVLNQQDSQRVGWFGRMGSLPGFEQVKRLA